MAKKKSSKEFYKVRYRYIGPRGDIRYSSVVLEAGSQEDAGELFSVQFAERRLRGLTVMAIEYFDGSQMDMLAWNNPGHGS